EREPRNARGPALQVPDPETLREVPAREPTPAAWDGPRHRPATRDPGASASRANGNPTCASPLSGVEWPRAETRKPWHTFGSQRYEPPRITRALSAPGVNGVPRSA